MNDNLKKYLGILTNDPQRAKKLTETDFETIRKAQIEAAIEDAAKDGITLTQADFETPAEEPEPVPENGNLCMCIAGGGGKLGPSSSDCCACVAVGMGFGPGHSCSCMAYGHGG